MSDLAPLDLTFRTRVFLIAALTAISPGAAASPDSTAIFSSRGDVGSVSRPLAASYDAVSHSYTIGASGANIWAARDDFSFVWTRATGDVAVAANISFQGASRQAHRKACLMIRRSLDPDSAYADVAVHGDGHIALQFRSETGGSTQTLQCSEQSPQRVRLEKRGPYVTLSLMAEDGTFTYSGCATRLTFEGSYYVGLAVCAHDNTAFETALFSNVELGAAPPPSAARASELEVLNLASLDRRVIYRSPGQMESPHFSPDGSQLYFNRGGRIYRLGISSSESPAVVETGLATHCNDDHGVSPDGSQLVISDLTETGKSRMYLLPIGGGAPKRVDVAEPAYWHSWSPDGRTLAYCAERNGNYDVYTIAIAGGQETRLTTAPGNDNGPDYTADGKEIYFHSERTGRMQIWRMRADGSNQEQVTNDEYYNWFPHPSPDGRWIVFLSTKVAPKTGHPPDGDYLLRLIPAGGGVPHEISRFYGGNGSFNIPCWSRDSSRIAYASFAPSP
jgi:TolB protein